MFKNLNTGAIGVKATLAEQLDFARRHGFAGIDFSIVEAQTLADTQGVDAVKALFANAGVKPGSWGFPVDYRKDEATWRSGLAALPKHAALAAALINPRCPRCAPGAPRRHCARPPRRAAPQCPERGADR